jgi:hypothetical protein
MQMTILRSGRSARRLRAAGVAIGVVALTAFAAPATALAQTTHASAIEVGDGALISDGLAIDVPVTATCATPYPDGFGVPGTVTLTVRQIVGDAVASSYAQRQVLCDGTPQNLTIRAYASFAPFAPDVALVTAQVSNGGGDFLEVDREVLLD